MKAMILAAGRGTRLKPLTDNCPKALIPVAGRPLLEHILDKMVNAGAKDIIINVHHHAQMIISYLEEHKPYDLNIQISREKELLDTGGGLKKVAWFFANTKAPFFLHNVDVLSGINLNQMMRYHVENNNLATLAVKNRESNRYLLFDDQNSLIGWQSLTPSKTEIARKTTEKFKRYAFLGIHILSPEIFMYLPALNNFSIIQAYLKIAESISTIRAYDCPDDYWFDAGKKADLVKIKKFFEEMKQV